MLTSANAFEPDHTKWSPWRPEEVAARLATVEAPWYVAAGWAIDLFLGEETREHEDVEVGVPRHRFGEITAALDGFELIEISSHQTWVREPATGLWRLDVFAEPEDVDGWICRRDERLRMPYDRLIEWTADGIPYSCPEVVLLFKAKHTRPKDEQDLAAVLPRLEPERRRWLHDALELVHPGHPWTSRVRA